MITRFALITLFKHCTRRVATVTIHYLTRYFQWLESKLHNQLSLVIIKHQLTGDRERAERLYNIHNAFKIYDYIYVLMDNFKIVDFISLGKFGLNIFFLYFQVYFFRSLTVLYYSKFIITKCTMIMLNYTGNLFLFVLITYCYALT